MGAGPQPSSDELRQENTDEERIQLFYMYTPQRDSLVPGYAWPQRSDCTYLEMTDVNHVKSDEGREEPDVCFSEVCSSEVAPF